MATVLRPLSTSELLDRTFHLYRNRFLVFISIAAIPQLIVLALRLWNAATLTEGQLRRLNWNSITAAVISWLALEFSVAATTIAVSNLHLDRPVSVGSAFNTAKSSVIRVIVLSLIIGFVSTLGLVFLIVPGIFLWLMWSLSIPVTVLEGGWFKSMARSMRLTEGSRGRIFVIYLLLIVLGFVVGMIFQAPLGILIVTLKSEGAFTLLPKVAAISAVISFVTTSLVGPLGAIAITLIYYDQRVRKEGFDLQLMMAALQPGPALPDAQAPAAAAAAPNS